jgi:hypothetical protein
MSDFVWDSDLGTQESGISPINLNFSYGYELSHQPFSFRKRNFLNSQAENAAHANNLSLARAGCQHRFTGSGNST